MSEIHSTFPGVIVVGGGYAGLHAARAIRSSGVDVLVIDPSPAHDFVTRLAAVAGGTAPVSDANAPHRDLGYEVRRAVVRRVEDGAVVLDDGERLDATAVVVAAGSIPARPSIPGLRRAATLRTSLDAIELRSRITDAASVIIAGGGASGVQLAGSVAAAHPGIRVEVVDREERLLGSMAPQLSERAAAILRDRGVVLSLGEEIVRMDASSVTLRSGRRLEGLVVWTGGFAAAGSSLGEHIPIRDGRIEIDPELRVQGWRRTFAVGDIADHRDRKGNPLPMSAQIAVQAGTHAGHNAVAVVRGESTAPASLRQQGWVLDLGGGRGVADLGVVALAAPLLDRLPPLLHFAIDVKNLVEIGGLRGLRFLPGLGRVPAATAVIEHLAPTVPERAAA